jgi:hypothetical protein
VGSKLAVLAAVVQLSVAGVASAQPAPQGPESYKTGLDAYKAGRYDEAARLLAIAYKEDAKPEILFALAQAERLSDHCDKAIPHYQQLLSQTTELATAKAVQNNLALCPGAERTADPKAGAKTIVRESKKTDPLAVGLLAGGALAGGFSIGMFLRSSSTRDDAGSARTLDDANRLNDNADRDRIIAIVSGGVGVVAIGFAVFRLMRSSESSSSEVAVTPTNGGSMFVFAKTW